MCVMDICIGMIQARCWLDVGMMWVRCRLDVGTRNLRGRGCGKYVQALCGRYGYMYRHDVGMMWV